jgi:hypothetical protein
MIKYCHIFLHVLIDNHHFDYQHKFLHENIDPNIVNVKEIQNFDI